MFFATSSRVTNAKLKPTAIIVTHLLHSGMPLFSKVHISKVWVSYNLKLEHWRAENLSWPRKLVVTAEAKVQKILHAWIIEPCLGCGAYLLLCLLLTLWCPGFSTQSQLDDSRWARGRGVRVWGGRKVPEEPLAFTLPSLVQVVFLVTLLACSLVVIIFFQVPHWWPAMFLKVLLVLCIRIHVLRNCKVSTVNIFFFCKAGRWFICNS